MKTTPMKNERKTDRKKERTPIMDGDARPDKMIEPDAPAEENKKPEDEKDALTSNRSADVNNLEDYKDAK